MRGGRSGLRLLNPHTTHATIRTNALESVQPSTREARGSRDVAVPTACTPGVTISPSRTQRGREHGNHQILPLLVNLPGAGSKLV